MDYTYLLLLALVLLSTKVFGLATEHVHLPQVVGALLAGIIMGPSGFGVLQSTDFLVKTAEIGVIMLMFTAGIDTDMKELKETGVRASVIAVLGVFVPLFLCGWLYFAFFCGGEFTPYNLLRSAFMGSVFSATSVSITVETLNEMGKLKTRTGTTLLSAALIDDIIGIVVLSILSDGKCWILGDQSLMILDSSGVMEDSYDYSSQYLKMGTLQGNGFATLFLSRSASGSSGTLVTVDSHGDEIGRLYIQGQALALAARGQDIALLTTGDVYTTTRKLENYRTLANQMGIRNLAIYQDGGVALIGSTSVSLYYPSGSRMDNEEDT